LFWYRIPGQYLDVTFFNCQEKGCLSYVGAGKIVHLVVHDYPRLPGHELHAGEAFLGERKKNAGNFSLS
jgi:hypothetical protein